MATRRRGGADLDDLKARLGLGDDGDQAGSGAVDAGADSDGADGDSDDEAPSPVLLQKPASSDAPAPAAPASTTISFSKAAAPAPMAAPAPAASAPRPAAPAPAPRPAAAPAPDEDFSSSVIEDQAVVLDPNAYDPSIKAPGTRSVLPFVLIGLVSIVGGLVGGLAMGMGAERRELENARISGAGTLLEPLRRVTGELAEVNSRVLALPVETTYSAEFDDVLRAAYAETPPVVGGDTIGRAGIFLDTDPLLTGRLIAFSNRTSFMQQYIESHLAVTAAELPAIEAELAGAATQTNYAIAYDFMDSFGRYNATFNDPPVPFAPVTGLRVEYANLETTMGPEGLPADQQSPLVNVTAPDGSATQVPIYNLILIPPSALQTGPQLSTALQRYVMRATYIKTALAELAGSQAQQLVPEIAEVAERPPVGTF